MTAYLSVQIIANKNRHADTDAEEIASRINIGAISRVMKDENDIGIRMSKQNWIRAGRAAETFPGNFVVIKVSDMTYEQALKLLESYPPFDPDNQEEQRVYERRWVFNPSNITPERQLEVVENGELTTTIAALENVLIDVVGEFVVGDL